MYVLTMSTSRQTDAGSSCVSFNVGKIKVNAKTGHYNLDFSEHRKMCNQDGQFLFEFGTMMGAKHLMVVGHSVKPEKNLKDYQFVTHTYVNDKQVAEQTLSYAQVGDLFKREGKSPLLAKYEPHQAMTGTAKSQVAPPPSPKWDHRQVPKLDHRQVPKWDPPVRSGHRQAPKWNHRQVPKSRSGITKI